MRKYKKMGYTSVEYTKSVERELYRDMFRNRAAALINYTIVVDGINVRISVRIQDVRSDNERFGHDYPWRIINWCVPSLKIWSFQCDTYAGLIQSIRETMQERRNLNAAQEAARLEAEKARAARVAKHQAKQRRRAMAQSLKAKLSLLNPKSPKP